MTPEERQMLQALANRIKSAPQQPRDEEADAMLRDLVRQRPDTAYLLAQTVLMQDLALRNAQAQIGDLQRQLNDARSAQPAQSSGSFLGGLFGGSPQPPPAAQQYRAPGPSAPPPAAGPWGRPAAAPPPQAYYTAPGAPVLQPAQGSSFLQQAATTAVGIAGGALLFEGIQSLFGPHYGVGFMGGPWGGGSWGAGGIWEGPPSLTETTIVNNYYDQPPPLSSDPGADYSQGGYDQGGVQDTSYDPGQDNAGFDNSDFDAGGGGDFGGGSDDFI